MYRIGRNVVTLAGAFALAVSLVLAQGPGGGAGKGGGAKGGAKGGPAPQNAKAQAPMDLTGTWVSLVTEDWLYRMVTPAKGDVASVPISPAGRAAANNWDPAKDEAAGNQCLAYGAAGLMRQPGRLQIDWADDNTLRVQMDAGTQTRLFHFTGDATGAPSLQGFSKASWDGIGRGGRGTFGVPAGATGDANATGPAAAQPIRPGSLKSVTTNLTAGYLRKNGVPYSANTLLTEYFDIIHQPDGTQYLIISTTVDDPANLTQPFRTSTHFKKEPNNSKFKPSACTAR